MSLETGKPLVLFELVIFIWEILFSAFRIGEEEGKRLKVMKPRKAKGVLKKTFLRLLY